MAVRAIILVLLVFLPLINTSHVKVTCSDGDSILAETNLREVYLQVKNDVWGDPKNHHEQCAFAGDGGLGWRWVKPTFSYQPYFPNVSLNVSQYVPLTVSELYNFRVLFSALVRGTGTYNLAIDIWLSSDRKGTQVTDEVMVWLLWTNRTVRNPIAVNDGYNDYGYLTFKASWRFHAFFLLANKIPYLVDLGRLFHFAGVRGYVKSLSLGNELFSGTGETHIYAINIEINDISVRNNGACYTLSCTQ